MKRLKVLFVFTLLISLVGCKKEETKYLQNTFYGPFDTVFKLNAYATEDDFDKYFDLLKEETSRLDQLYDKYNDYEGINNIKTINDNAGIAPVVVEQEIIDLLLFSKEKALNESMKVNIALGSVLEIWHEYREEKSNQLPSLEELNEANQYTDINKLIIDEEAMSVYLKDSHMSLDVGATAKGYAAELIKDKLVEAGCEAFILSAGGNIVSYGERLINSSNSTSLADCASKFCVGITNPGGENYSTSDNIALLVIDNNKSVVTSGDYQRNYYVDGVSYHHLIDPNTLFPGTYMRSLTIVTEDSGYADFLSTFIFLESYEDGVKIVESLEGVEAIWALNDGTIKLSSGLVIGENIHIYE